LRNVRIAIGAAPRLSGWEEETSRSVLYEKKLKGALERRA
jgi:hypothetical protein